MMPEENTLSIGTSSVPSLASSWLGLRDAAIHAAIRQGNRVNKPVARWLPGLPLPGEKQSVKRSRVMTSSFTRLPCRGNKTASRISLAFRKTGLLHGLPCRVARAMTGWRVWGWSAWRPVTAFPHPQTHPGPNGTTLRKNIFSINDVEDVFGQCRSAFPGRARHPPRQTEFWENFRPLAGRAPRSPRGRPFWLASCIQLIFKHLFSRQCHCTPVPCQEGNQGGRASLSKIQTRWLRSGDGGVSIASQRQGSENPASFSTEYDPPLNPAVWFFGNTSFGSIPQRFISPRDGHLRSLDRLGGGWKRMGDNRPGTMPIASRLAANPFDHRLSWGSSTGTPRGPLPLPR